MAAFRNRLQLNNPLHFAPGVPLPVGVTQTALFQADRPVDHFTVAVVVSGVANPQADLTISAGWTFDEVAVCPADSQPSMTAAGILMGRVSFPKAPMFVMSMTNNNAANTSATVDAWILAPGD